MRADRARLALLAVVTAGVLAGCSASPGTPAASGPVTSHSAEAAALPPGCAASLAALPAAAPATVQQAGDDIVALSGHKENTAASLANDVVADATQIGLDIGGAGGNMATDLSKWDSDVTALRAYCK